MNETNPTAFSKIKLHNAARVLVEEIRRYGFSTDTMASDRFHNFCKALSEAGHSVYADRAETIDDKSRQDAEIYALMVIGLVCLGGDDPATLFRKDTCGR